MDNDNYEKLNDIRTALYGEKTEVVRSYGPRSE